jgi:hypothetical protein
MKVRIVYTVEVSDEYRRALNFRYGRPGLATRNEMKYYFQQWGNTTDEDLMSEYATAVKNGEEKAW